MRKLFIVSIIALLPYRAWGDAAMWLNTARIAYYNEKDFERAKNACLKGIEEQPNNYEFHAILGGSEIGLGNWKDASVALMNAFKIDTSKTMKWMKERKEDEKYYYQAFYFSALEFFTEARYEEALSNLEYGKLLAPEDIETYALRGALLITLERREEGNKEYRKALAIDPERPDILYLLGKSLFEERKFDSSLTHFDNAVTFYNHKRARAAEMLFKNISEASTELTQNIITLWTEKRLEELDQLIKDELNLDEGLDVHEGNIEQFVRITNALARSHYFAGMSQYNLQKDSLALHNLLKSLESNPIDLDALYFTGEILLVKFKKFQDAAAYFRRIVQIERDDVYAWFYLGVCYTQLKQYQEAISAYENNVLRLNPEHINAMTNLASIYSALGDQEKSLEYLMKVEELKKKMQ
ncbi:MAG: tetratricopeptide repeat protein [candidate division WOR-3 bacterium]|nr:MAG: tetratricopeptide repeat protein [candidate division WOR-3 bacterium]